MPRIPDLINSVNLVFAKSVNRDVNQALIDGMFRCIQQDIGGGHLLEELYISSAFDSHSWPSRHVQRKAVDISRVNGTRMIIGYPDTPLIYASVVHIQTTFETFRLRRENFGPYFKKKLGRPHSISGHEDHIHISVN